MIDQTPINVIDYSQYRCEKCGTMGVCEAGMDVFIASLCQACFDKEWQGYVSASSGMQISAVEAKLMYEGKLVGWRLLWFRTRLLWTFGWQWVLRLLTRQ